MPSLAFSFTSMAHVVLKLEFKTVANATVAWQRGAWYLRAAMSWQHSIA
jgi:hypothetical protein